MTGNNGYFPAIQDPGLLSIYSLNIVRSVINEFTSLAFINARSVRVLETVVFPTALYGCEAWTINNTDAKKDNIF